MKRQVSTAATGSWVISTGSEIGGVATCANPRDSPPDLLKRLTGSYKGLPLFTGSCAPFAPLHVPAEVPVHRLPGCADGFGDDRYRDVGTLCLGYQPVGLRVEPDAFVRHPGQGVEDAFLISRWVELRSCHWLTVAVPLDTLKGGGLLFPCQQETGSGGPGWDAQSAGATVRRDLT